MGLIPRFGASNQNNYQSNIAGADSIRTSSIHPFLYGARPQGGEVIDLYRTHLSGYTYFES